MSATTTQNFLGKCREEGCDYVLFATPEDMQPAEGFRDVTAGTGMYRVNGGYFARCTNRHKVFPMKPVQGTYSEHHKCDSRCLNAKGWTCTCSCGGANHGRGHVATVTKAASLPSGTTLAPIGPPPAHPQDPTPAPVTVDDFRVQPVAPSAVPPITSTPALKHLGEPGQRMRGEVRVTGVRNLDRTTLYAFETVNGGHVVKWFVPLAYDPAWVEGQTYMVRFKVKAHGEFRGVPETVVTYVEEVE